MTSSNDVFHYVSMSFSYNPIRERERVCVCERESERKSEGGRGGLNNYNEKKI